MIRALLHANILALVLLLGGMPVQAQRPDPHLGEPAPAVAAPVDAGCDLVLSYTRDFYEALENSGAFFEFFGSDVGIGDVSASEANDIIRDGNALIERLQGLDVPPAYAEAHAGILTFMQFQVDSARFYGLDTSVVPDIAAQEQAFRDIRDGEAAIVQACPDEIQEVGGYILINPEDGPPTPVDPNEPAN